MQRSDDINRDSLNIYYPNGSDSSENELGIVYDKNTKSNIDAINQSAENVDEVVEGGKLIASQISSSSESVVFLKPRVSQEGSEEHSVEFIKKTDETDEGNVFHHILGSKEESSEAVAPLSSNPTAPSLEKKEKGLKKLAEKAKAAVSKVKAAKEERATTKATAEAKAAVEQYFNTYRDKMFDKTNSAYRAYFKLLGFDIDTFVNPGMELGRFKEYITQLILDNKIKKSNLSPENLNKILTELINKQVDIQHDDRIKGQVLLSKLQNKK